MSAFVAAPNVNLLSSFWGVFGFVLAVMVTVSSPAAPGVADTPTSGRGWQGSDGTPAAGKVGVEVGVGIGVGVAGEIGGVAVGSTEVGVGGGGGAPRLVTCTSSKPNVTGDDALPGET